MSMFDRIKKLAEKKNKTPQQVAEELNFGKNYFYSLNAGKSPSAEKLEQIATYFNVSVDYILGRTDNPYLGQTDEQRALTIEEALDSVMSYGGKPVSENDREVLKRITEAYLDGKI